MGTVIFFTSASVSDMIVAILARRVHLSLRYRYLMYYVLVPYSLQHSYQKYYGTSVRTYGYFVLTSTVLLLPYLYYVRATTSLENVRRSTLVKYRTIIRRLRSTTVPISSTVLLAYYGTTKYREVHNLGTGRYGHTPPAKYFGGLDGCREDSRNIITRCSDSP